MNITNTQVYPEAGQGGPLIERGVLKLHGFEAFSCERAHSRAMGADGRMSGRQFGFESIIFILISPTRQ
jgi:hypothetical protein